MMEVYVIIVCSEIVLKTKNEFKVYAAIRLVLSDWVTNCDWAYLFDYISKCHFKP